MDREYILTELYVIAPHQQAVFIDSAERRGNGGRTGSSQSEYDLYRKKKSHKRTSELYELLCNEHNRIGPDFRTSNPILLNILEKNGIELPKDPLAFIRNLMNKILKKGWVKKRPNPENLQQTLWTFKEIGECSLL